MPQLPTLSGPETVRNFERLGWNVARQRGSHIVMTRPRGNGDAFGAESPDCCQRNACAVSFAMPALRWPNFAPSCDRRRQCPRWSRKNTKKPPSTLSPAGAMRWMRRRFSPQPILRRCGRVRPDIAIPDDLRNYPKTAWQQLAQAGAVADEKTRMLTAPTTPAGPSPMSALKCPPAAAKRCWPRRPCNGCTGKPA